MFWWLLIIFLAFCGYIINRFEEDENIAAIFWGLIIVILFSNALLMTKGIPIYPKLLSLRTEAVTLQKNVKTLKQSLIETKSQVDLPNFQIATRIADYIKECAKKKAEYNAKLKYYQTIKRMKIHYWFGYAMYISNKIYELRPIE